MVGAAKYLTGTLGARILYLDEFGYGARICYSKRHPHDSPYPHYYGEREMTRRIREAVGDEVAICTENLPEDTRLQWQEAYYVGGIGRYLSLKRWAGVALNPVRFAFPETKCFNLIYGYSLKDGNWDLLKFVLFNGDAYALSRSYDPASYFEDRSRELLKKIFRILHENSDAFASRDVEPLIPTEVPGVFVNAFKGTNGKTVWTIFNGNYRTVRGKAIETASKPGAKYVDVWNECPVKAEVAGSKTSLDIEVGPRDIACIVEQF
jgi:hypothetical protein